MSKKILFIENDSAFAAGIAESLEATGFEVRVTGEGKDGLDLAREWEPDAIVLCVELPGMSGYLVCQKLKKDDVLKAVPLVLTSAEATEETFEKHKTLKARADEYLLKPYPPQALLEKIGALIGLPEGATGVAPDEHEEELVTLEEEAGLEAADGQPDAELPNLDLQSLPDEPAAGGEASPGDEDEDLRLLDDAFEGLSDAAPGAKEAAAALDLELAGEKPVPGDEVDAAAASLPEEDEGSARDDLGALDLDAESALGALGGGDETLSPGFSLGAAPASAAASRPRGASADLLRAAGIKLLDDDPHAASDGDAPGVDEPTAARDLDDGFGGVRQALERARADLSARDAEVRDLRKKSADAARRADDATAKAESALAQVRIVESDLKAARDEARRAAERARAAENEIQEARRKLADAERRVADAEDDARRKGEEAAAAAEAVGKAEALEREADELRTELLVARSEAEGARGEVEKRTAELRKRVGDLEAANAKNEERVVKAYQKIKADEKVRDKVRKALAIASQLLEEGLAAESPAEKGRAASLLGRE